MKKVEFNWAIFYNLPNIVDRKVYHCFMIFVKFWENEERGIIPQKKRREELIDNGGVKLTNNLIMGLPN